MKLLELKTGIAITSYLTYVIYFNKREIICLKLKKTKQKKKSLSTYYEYSFFLNLKFKTMH